VKVNGRVAALLELGSGFHADLTGAENINLNASLLGLSRKRTEYLFDSIVEFSGIADFINEPLRTYSLGMVMRLGFSVAVNVDPDILILDEVFAVGDQNFQAKCREKVLEFKKAGKTMICVSHASATLHQLCERAIWLDQGELMMDGPTDEVLTLYEGRSAYRTGN
jgi:lipopolysaccharide transport system ATP-binding protein